MSRTYTRQKSVRCINLQEIFTPKRKRHFGHSCRIMFRILIFTGICSEKCTFISFLMVTHLGLNSDLKSALPPLKPPTSAHPPPTSASGDEARRQTRPDLVFFPQRKGISTGLLLTTSTRRGSGAMQQKAGDHFGPLNYNQ